MANLKNAHPLNFHIGPQIFLGGKDNKSIVVKQPESDSEWKEAKRAILSCPTNSIGVHDDPAMFKDVDPELPYKINDNVFYLGFTSRDSFRLIKIHMWGR